MSKPNDTYCPLPFVATTTSPDGYCRLCCESTIPYYTKVTDLKQWWNGDTIKEIRRKMLQGEHVKDCEPCYSDEKHIGVSTRTHEIAHWGQVEQASELPIYLDMKLGNFCNFRCLMCDPLSSNRIMNEWRELGWDKGMPFKAGSVNNHDISTAWSTDWSWPNGAEFWKIVQDCITSGGKKLKFTGGEPFLNPHMLKIISTLDKDINLKFTTNGSIWNNKIENALKNRSDLHIAVSIEGTKLVNDYIRDGSEYDVIVKNYNQMKKYCKTICWQACVGAINLQDMPDFIAQCLEKKHYIALQEIRGPEFMRITALTKQAREETIQKLNDLKSTITSGMLGPTKIDLTANNETVKKLFAHTDEAKMSSVIDSLVKIIKSSLEISQSSKSLISYLSTLDKSRNKNYESILKHSDLNP